MGHELVLVFRAVMEEGRPGDEQEEQFSDRE